MQPGLTAVAAVVIAVVKRRKVKNRKWDLWYMFV